MKILFTLSAFVAVMFFAAFVSAPDAPATAKMKSKRFPELNKSVAGRPLPVDDTPGTNVHELTKNDHDVVYLTLFNSDTVARWVEISYNAYTVAVSVPAGDSKLVGPFALSGRTSDGTEVSNKNLILEAEVADKIHVMGSVN